MNFFIIKILYYNFLNSSLLLCNINRYLNFIKNIVKFKIVRINEIMN